MREAYIVAYGRSPVVKGKVGGTYYQERPEEIAAQVLKGVIERVGGDFNPSQIDDVIVGCSIPENLQGMNIGRKVVLQAGLDEKIPAQTINRFCASGLQSIASASQAIISGQAEVMVAGGLEFQSTTPATSVELTSSPELENHGPSLSVSMGITAENVAEKYQVSAHAQNEFAVSSHQKADRAQRNELFKDEIIPVQVNKTTKKFDKIQAEKVWVTEDEGIRPDTNVETIAKLPTIFKKGGTVTAATSSQISDGASFVVIVSKEKLKEWRLEPVAKFIGYQVAGVAPDYMGIGPVEAIPKVLERAQLKIEDMDIIELNEAFAAQAIAVIEELGLDSNKVNPNGGAIALGHPNGATGSILTSRLLAEMKKQSDARYGMVTMCIGGGMGAAGIFEYIHKDRKDREV